MPGDTRETPSYLRGGENRITEAAPATRRGAAFQAWP